MDEIYDRSDLVDERQVAMARWDSYVEGQIPGRVGSRPRPLSTGAVAARIYACASGTDGMSGASLKWA